MNVQLCYILVIFLMYSTLFVELCPSRSSPGPRQSSGSNSGSSSQPVEPTTRQMSAVIKKEMMFAPIKGKTVN